MTHNVDLVLLPGRSNKLSLLPNLCSQSSNLLSTALHIFASGAPMTLVFIDKKHKLFGRLIPRSTGQTDFYVYKFLVMYVYNCIYHAIYHYIHRIYIYIIYLQYILPCVLLDVIPWSLLPTSFGQASLHTHLPTCSPGCSYFGGKNGWLDDMVRDNAIQPIIQEKGQTLNSDNQLLICSGIGFTWHIAGTQKTLTHGHWHWCHTSGNFR